MPRSTLIAILFASFLALMAASAFAAPPPKTLTIEVSGSGTVTLDPPGGVYPRNTTVTLTALPGPNWTFDHWEGGALHGVTDNPATLLVTRNLTVTAFFTTQGGSLDGIRRDGATIRVLSGGNPAPGVDVQIDMTDIDFGFGTAIAAQPLDYPEYANWIRDNYNWAVAENASKWPQNEPLQGVVSYTNADTIYNFAAAHGIRMRGHTVFWAVPDFVQQWVKDLAYPGELQDAVDARLVDAVGHFDGKYAHWDVNNEMLHGSFFADRLGAGIRPYMFNQVKALDPEVLTFVNDYNIISGGYEYDEYLQQISNLIAAGAHIDGIGVQGHFSGGDTMAQITERLDGLAAFGLPIWVTEYDYADPDPVARADYLEDFYRTAFSHPAVEGILMWGFWANAHWRGADAALLDADFTVNAAGQRYLALRAEWWTNEAGVSDTSGEVSFNGYFGDYAVTLSDGVNPPEVHILNFTAGGANSFDLELGTGQAADVLPPDPDPATWTEPPAGATRDVITMAATPAVDPSGVEYYFSNLDDPSHDSGWQASPLYRDSGLLADSSYNYTVTVRDLSLGQNETAPSISESAATAVDDGNLVVNEGFEYGTTEAWVSYAGAAVSAQSDIVRSGDFAARASDRIASWDGMAQDLTAHAVNGVTWQCSGWVRLEGTPSAPIGMTMLVRDQTGDTYTGIVWSTGSDSAWTELSGPITVSWSGALELVRLYFEGPDPGTSYLLDDVACYGAVSGNVDMWVDDIAMSLVTQGPNNRGRATVTVVDEHGAPLAGATVSGTWSGLVSDSANAVTDGAGAVTLTSPKTRSSGTFTFTVDAVVADGYSYEPSSNVETSDSISTP